METFCLQLGEFVCACIHTYVLSIVVCVQVCVQVCLKGGGGGGGGILGTVFVQLKV